MKNITIQTEMIKLDQFLKYAGAAETGGECKLLIQQGFVFVNEEREERRGRKLYSGDRVRVSLPDRTEEYTVIA